MEPCGQARGPCGPTSFEPRLVAVPGRDVVSREEVQARLRMGWPAACHVERHRLPTRPRHPRFARGRGEPPTPTALQAARHPHRRRPVVGSALSAGGRTERASGRVGLRPGADELHDRLALVDDARRRPAVEVRTRIPRTKRHPLRNGLPLGGGGGCPRSWSRMGCQPIRSS